MKSRFNATKFQNTKSYRNKLIGIVSFMGFSAF